MNIERKNMPEGNSLPETSPVQAPVVESSIVRRPSFLDRLMRRGFPVREVLTNASLPETERLATASQSLKTELTKEQEKAILTAHEVGVGELGRNGSEAGVFNYTKEQRLRKEKILEEAGFNKEQIDTLMKFGIIGRRLTPTEVARVEPRIAELVDKMTDPKLKKIAQGVMATGQDGNLDEVAVQSQISRIEGLSDGDKVPEDEAGALNKVLEELGTMASKSFKSEFQLLLDKRAKLEDALSPDKAKLEEAQAEVNKFLERPDAQSLIKATHLRIDEFYRTIYLQTADPRTQRAAVRAWIKEQIQANEDTEEMLLRNLDNPDLIPTHLGVGAEIIHRAARLMVHNADQKLPIEARTDITVNKATTQDWKVERYEERNAEIEKDLELDKRDKALKEFIELDSLVTEQTRNAIVKYLESRNILEDPSIMKTYFPSFTEEQREAYLKQAKVIVDTTSEERRILGDRALTNWQFKQKVRQYVEAVFYLEDPDPSDPADVKEANILKYKKFLKEASPEVVKFAKEYTVAGYTMDNPGSIDSELDKTKEIAEARAKIKEIFRYEDSNEWVTASLTHEIELLQEEKRPRLLAKAINLVLEEEKLGYNVRNYYELGLAYDLLEDALPEAMTESALMGLQFEMNKLYNGYRQKMLNGEMTGVDETAIENLEKDMLGRQDRFWQDESNRFTQEFIDKWKPMRIFYIHRAFQRFNNGIRDPERWKGIVEEEQRADELFKRGAIDEDQYKEMTVFGSQRAQYERFASSYRDNISELDDKKVDGTISDELYEVLKNKALSEYQKKIYGNLEQRRLILGEWTPKDAEIELRRIEYEKKAAEQIQEEEKQKLDLEALEEAGGVKEPTYWTRQMGYVYLQGETQNERPAPEQIKKGVMNFLKVATGKGSTMDAQRYIEDGTRLAQEIILKGREAGMDEDEMLELAAFAEGYLLITVARHFGTIAGAGKWNQVMGMFGMHFNTKLSAVTKAYGGQVMQATNLLDIDPEFRSYGRPAKYERDETTSNKDKAGIARAKIQRKLVVRIATSELKSRMEIIKEHFEALDDPMKEAVLSSEPALDMTGDKPEVLFDLTSYKTEIKRVEDKLADFNKKYGENPTGILPGDMLSPVETQLLALHRISQHKNATDLVTIDQTEVQFRDLYKRDFDRELEEYKQDLLSIPDAPKYESLTTRYQEELTGLQLEKAKGEKSEAKLKRLFKSYDREKCLVIKELLFNKFIEGELTASERICLETIMPNWEDAVQAVDLAIQTRDVLYVSTEQASTPVTTRTHLPETDPNRGELISSNDVTRVAGFVRNRAILALPTTVAEEITELTNVGQGFSYVEIADKLEHINQLGEIITGPMRDVKIRNSDETHAVAAKAALDLIKLTSDEDKLKTAVQVVEYAIEEALKQLREKGTSLTVADIDTIITAKLGGLKDASATVRLNSAVQSIHKGQSHVRPTESFEDIVNREDADPQYNFNALDDDKYRTLLLSDANRAAAYNPKHPYYLSVPARTLRVLDPTGTILKRIPGDPIKEKVLAYQVMERQRRFFFAVDSVKAFATFDHPNLYSHKPDGKLDVWESDFRHGLFNPIFTGMRGLSPREWAKRDPGMIVRGRGWIKYHESNIRDLAHATGVKGIRGITAVYEGYDPRQSNAFEGAMDAYRMDRWLDQQKSGDEQRAVLTGGKVGDNQNFEGLFKKLLSTPGRVVSNYKMQQAEAGVGQLGGAKQWLESSPLYRIAEGKQKLMASGDIEVALGEGEKIWERHLIYGNSFGFVGNVSHTALAAKFIADTMFNRMAYWAVAHPEAWETYNDKMYIVRTILIPLERNTFGENATLAGEMKRRHFLAK